MSAEAVSPEANRRRRRRLVALLALLLLALIAAAVWWMQRPTGPSLYDMLVDLRAELDAPGLTVEAAAKSLATPEAAYAFVRDRVRYSPYPGRQQEAETVLRSRVANDPDRAVLLAKLLEAMDQKVELRFEQLARRPETAPAPGLARLPRNAAQVKLIADRIGYTLADEQANLLKVDTAFADRMDASATILAKAEARIRSMVGFGEPHPAPDPTQATIDLTRVWVDVLDADGAVTARFDPTYPDLPFPESFAVYAGAPAITSISLAVEREGGVADTILEWHGPVPLGEVVLGFVPTVDPVAAFGGAPDPAKVPMWTPLLNLGDQQVTGLPIDAAGRHYGSRPDLPPPYAPGGNLAGTGGRLVSARLAGIDASRFPEVSVALDLRTNGVPTWTAEDFLLTDRGVAEQARIRSLGLETRPLIVVTDVSGSMAGERFYKARDAILALVARLDPATEFGLVDFAGSANVVVPLAPVGDGETIRTAVQALGLREDTGIIIGMDAAVAMAGDRPATFLLLTDGQDNMGGDADALVAELKRHEHDMIAVAIGPEPDTALLQRLVREAGGSYQRFEDPAPLAALYASLADDLSGRIVLDYTADPGEGTRDVALGIANFAEQLTGQYDAPAEPAPAGQRLVLTVTTEAGGTQKVASRPIVALGRDDTAWSLLGQFRLMFDLGAYPEDVGTAGYLTNWIDLLRPATEPVAEDARIDFESASTIGALRAVATGLAGDGVDLSPGPNVYLIRQFTDPDGSVRNAFDVMQIWDRFGLGKTDVDAFHLQLGLGLAEGFMFHGGDAVTPLADAPDLAVLHPGTPVPETWSAAISALRATTPYHYTEFFYAPSTPSTAWAVDFYDKSFAPFVGVGDSLAKGAYAVEIAKGFDKIDTLLALYGYSAGFGLGQVNGVIGPGFSALVALKREENKLWCFSSVMLGYVSEAIDGTDDLVARDPDKAQANAASLCKMDGRPEDFATRALRVMGKAAGTSWAFTSGWEAIKYRGLDYSWTPPKGFKRPPPGVKLSEGFVPLDGAFHSALAVAAQGENPSAFE